MFFATETGLDLASLLRCLDECLYTLPGTDAHRDTFSVLLTGSRALGTWVDASDVDLDVVCPRAVYDSVLAASAAAGLVDSPTSFFRPLPDPGRYFPGRTAHVSLTPLEAVARHFREYHDVSLWIWTNARIVTDPQDQFRRIVEGFHGYPHDVLVRKIKYRWLLSEYWAIDVYPHHHTREDQLLAAAAALVNSVHDLIRFFFLVEGKPFPYGENLLRMAPQTALGRRFQPLLQEVTDLVVGKTEPAGDPWVRLDRAFGLIIECTGVQNAAMELWDACVAATREAGVDPRWIEADYNNIEELFRGDLGPPPA